MSSCPRQISQQQVLPKEVYTALLQKIYKRQKYAQFSPEALAIARDPKAVREYERPVREER